MDKYELILDTDVGSDCDDMMALTYLIYAQRHLNVKIRAVTHCLSTPYGVPVIRGFFRFFGEELPPIGKMIGGAELKDHYSEAVAKRFAVAADYEESPCAVAVLRQALATAEGRCVICAVGQFTNISALLESRPDEISPLNGVELVRKKCARFVAMAGKFVPDEKAEWNIRWDIPATRSFFTLSPVPIILLPSETGKDVLTGETSVQKYGETTPLTFSFMHFLGASRGHRMNPPMKRSSWDPMAAVYAVEGARDFFEESEPGNVLLDEQGFTTFEPFPDGKFRILTKKSGAANRIASYIDACAETVLAESVG